MRTIIAVLVVALVALPVMAETVLIPDDINVVDNAAVGGNLTVSGSLSAGTQISAATFSIPTILQWMVYEFDESNFSGNAYPDTFINVSKAHVFVAPCSGSIVDVITYIRGDGDAAWDSLTVDVFVGVGSDTSCLTVTPGLFVAQGDKATSKEVAARDATTDPTTRDITCGEVVELSARTYGTVTGPPTGLKVQVIFAPDH